MKRRRRREEEEEDGGAKQKGMDAWISVWNYMVLYGFLV